MEKLKDRQVTLYISSTLYQLSGYWQWQGQNDAVFCSDVLLTPPAGFLGTRGIFHPDDVTDVKQGLQTIAALNTGDLHFRMITSYGEVKTITGNKVQLLDPANEQILSETFQKELHLIELEKQLEEFGLKKDIAEYAERLHKIGIWFFNTSTYQVWFSDNLYRICGVPPESLNPHLYTFLPFVHPDEKEIVQDAFEASVRNKVPLHMEFRFITPDKKLKWLLFTTQWLFNTKGEEVLSGVISDETENKELQQKLEGSQWDALFQKSLVQMDEKAASIGHWYVNMVTRKVYFSESCFRMHGLKGKCETASFETFIQFIHSDDREKIEEAYKKIYKEKMLQEIEFRIIRQDGRIRHLRMNGHLLNMPGDEVMIGFMQDVTVQVLSERKMREITEAFSLQNFATTEAETIAHFGSWLWNLQTNTISFSEGFFDLFGHKIKNEDDVQTQLPRLVHQDDREQFSGYLNGVLQHQKEAEFEFRLVRAGTIRYFKSFYKIASFDDKDFFVGIFQDITADANLRKKLTDRILLSELITENILDRAVITDENNTIVLWNRKCEEVYKIKKEAAIGKNIFDVFPQLKNEDDLKLFHRALNGETVYLPHEKGMDGDGYHDLHMMPLKNPAGEVFGIIHLLHDVTKEAVLQQHLNDRVRFIENLLDATVDRIVVLDRQMNYSYWNKRAEQYYGIEKEKVIGKNILELFPVFLNDPAYESLRTALRGEIVHVAAAQDLQEKKGYYETYLIPLKNEKNEVSGVLWIVHDLTAEWMIQEEHDRFKEAQQKLNETQQWLQQTALASPDSITVYDLVNKQPIYLNHCLADWLGISSEALVNMGFQGRLAFIHEEDRLGVLHFNEKVAASEDDEVYSIEYRLLTKKGQQIWVRNRSKVFQRNSNHHVTHSICFLQEITEEKRIEQELKKQNHLIVQVSEATPDFVLVFDYIQNKVIYVNKHPYQQNERRYQELLSATYEQILSRAHTDDREALDQFMQSFKKAKDEQLHTLEFRVLNNEEVIWYKSTGKVFQRDAKGNVIQIIEVLHDITSEVNLRHQLMERNRFVETVLNNSIDRIMVFNKHHKIVGWNKRCEEYFGVLAKEVIGKHYSAAFPKEDSVLHKALEDAFNGEMIHIEQRKSVFSNDYAELFYVPLKNEETVYGVLCIEHDITNRVLAEKELKELNTTLEQKNKELEERNEEITHFAFVASHDLKEPLRKIHTFSDWLYNRESEYLSSIGKNYVTKIALASKRLESLIEDILVLTKVHADTQKVDNVDPNKIIEKVKEDFATKIEETGAEINVGKMPSLRANENQLFYLLSNLISNAIKFQKPGNRPVINLAAEIVEGKFLKERAARPGWDYVKISVTDNGLGFDKKYVKKVFQVFQRLHAKHEFEGTGMGLAICKTIMDNHEGFITVKSEEDNGSQFCCFFPL